MGLALMWQMHQIDVVALPKNLHKPIFFLHESSSRTLALLRLFIVQSINESSQHSYFLFCCKTSHHLESLEVISFLLKNNLKYHYILDIISWTPKARLSLFWSHITFIYAKQPFSIDTMTTHTRLIYFKLSWVAGNW